MRDRKFIVAAVGASLLAAQKSPFPALVARRADVVTALVTALGVAVVSNARDVGELPVDLLDDEPTAEAFEEMDRLATGERSMEAQIAASGAAMRDYEAMPLRRSVSEPGSGAIAEPAGVAS